MSELRGFNMIGQEKALLGRSNILFLSNRGGDVHAPLNGGSSMKLSLGSDYVRVAAFVTLNAIPSIIIPYLLSYYKLMSDAELILLGVLLWISTTMFGSLYQTTKLFEGQKRDIALWKSQDSFDSKLSNIRIAYRKLLATKRSTTDLFQSFFEDRIGELDKMITVAADRGELQLEDRQIVSVDELLSSFNGEAHDIFRPVHFFKDNEFFFTWAKEYFYRVFDLVKRKKIREVRRLMICEKDEELKEPRSIKLMRFHATEGGYSYKVMRMNDFRRLLRDYQLECPRDFGIYGNYYVYRARTNELDNITGEWLKDPELVHAYIRFFDACWKSPTSFTPKDVNKTTRIALEELFGET
jgi:hypothetical protein